MLVPTRREHIWSIGKCRLHASERYITLVTAEVILLTSITVHHSSLHRLPPQYYLGRQYVLWTLCVQDRQTGWLDASLDLQWRELWLHAAWRYHVAVVAYCLMPDHAHFLVGGLDERADQIRAIRFFRKESNATLRGLGFCWQTQPHDHVLRARESRDMCRSTAHYIFENPVRKGLVAQATEWPYAGSILPGYPNPPDSLAKAWSLFHRSLSWL